MWDIVWILSDTEPRIVGAGVRSKIGARCSSVPGTLNEWLNHTIRYETHEEYILWHCCDRPEDIIIGMLQIHVWCVSEPGWVMQSMFQCGKTGAESMFLVLSSLIVCLTLNPWIENESCCDENSKYQWLKEAFTAIHSVHHGLHIFLLIKDHLYRMVKEQVQQYLTKPNHCIWPIRTH